MPELPQYFFVVKISKSLPFDKKKLKPQCYPYRAELFADFHLQGEILLTLSYQLLLQIFHYIQQDVVLKK
jgi:hypothetical protein